LIVSGKTVAFRAEKVKGKRYSFQEKKSEKTTEKRYDFEQKKSGKTVGFSAEKLRI